jgi:hypothetical protein
MRHLINQITGHSQEAESWIKDSSLPNSTKESWLKFIQKFPDLEYYKLKDASAPDEPVWLQTMSATLRGFVPQGLLWVQLDEFTQSKSADRALNKIWYHRMFTTEVSSEYERILLSEYELLILYSWLETLGSILAVKVNDGADQRIYEFSYNDIIAHNDSEGQISPEATRVAYNSYAEMLDHIVAVKLETGEVIRAYR